MNNTYTVVSGFRRKSEAEAFAVEERKKGVSAEALWDDAKQQYIVVVASQRDVLPTIAKD